MVRAKDWAASTYTGSFIVTSACKGVLVVPLRTVQTSRLGASKVAIEGYGFERRQFVYMPLLKRSSPVLVFQSIPPPKAALIPISGCGGRTGGPNIFLLNKPETARA